MRPLLTLIAAMTLTTSVPGQDTEKPKLESTKQKISYGIGMNIGRQFKQQNIDVDLKIVALGIATILAGDDPLISEDEIQAAFTAMRAEADEKRLKLVTENKEKAVKFLTANIKKDGVQQTKSGLQYLVLKEGTGAKPTTNDEVATHYRGKFMDGKVFDESYKGDSPTAAESPVEFPVTGVISGWTEALQLMKVGARYRLFVPPELAYKVAGRPGIPPNSLLIFDIELVRIK